MTPKSVRTSSSPPPAFDSTAKKGHVFDSSPWHPYNLPIDADVPDPGIKGPRSIDIGARREWLNSLLYYIGADLGIKKALAIPYMEGYMPIVKPRVDEILGR